MSIVQEKMYMDVDDVCAILGVSKAYAYNLMREYNKELKAKGYIVVAGKISTKFLAEKIYGMKLCSNDFISAIDFRRYGYKPAQGLATDVAALKRNGLEVSCVNLSCGYYEL